MRADRIGAITLAGVATIGLFWVLAPFRSAILWAVAAAILFSPLFHRLDHKLGGRPNLAAAS